MTMDFDRLAHAVREARDARGWRQEDLAARAHIGLGSVQNIEAGRPFRRTPTSFPKIEDALGWERGSCMAIVRGGQSTPRASAPAPVRADAQSETPGENLPLAVQIALGFGQIIDYDVYTTDVDGEPMQMVQLAISSAQAIEAMKKQLDRFGEIKGYVRRHAENEGEVRPTGSETDSGDE